MKRSSESSSIDLKPELDLPEEPFVRFLPPHISVDAMIRRNREMRESFPHSLPTEEERLSRKVHAEFVFK
jgi:hypothetical protein